MSRPAKMCVSMTSGFIAGVAAAIISHPDESPVQHCQRDWLCQALHHWSWPPMHHDWNPHCWAVPHFRHRDADHGRGKVPLPRPCEATLSVSMPFSTSEMNGISRTFDSLLIVGRTGSWLASRGACEQKK